MPSLLRNRVTVPFLSLLVFVGGLGFSSSANADFVNGVERFNGNTLDTTTWEYYRQSTVSQNDELMFTNPTLHMTEATTRQIQILSGQGVRAMVKLDDYTQQPNHLGLAALMLTSNESGASDWWINDNTFVDIEISIADTLGSRITMGDQNGGQVIHNFGSSLLGTTFWLELERLSINQTRVAAYDLQNQLIVENVRNSTNLNAALFINLTSNGTARFDNVTLIPEPTSMGIASFLVAGIVLVSRRRRI